MSKAVAVILVILLLIALGGGAYIYWTFSQTITDRDKEITDLKSEIETLKKSQSETGALELTQKVGDSKRDTYNSSEKVVSGKSIAGWEVKIPADWAFANVEAPQGVYDATQAKSYTLEGKVNNKAITITVITQLTDSEGLLKESFEIQKTTVVTIAQISGEKLEVLDNKDGKAYLYYLVKKDSGLYVIKGLKENADILDQIVKTFSILAD